LTTGKSKTLSWKSEEEPKTRTTSGKFVIQRTAHGKGGEVRRRIQEGEGSLGVRNGELVEDVGEMV